MVDDAKKNARRKKKPGDMCGPVLAAVVDLACVLSLTIRPRRPGDGDQRRMSGGSGIVSVWCARGDLVQALDAVELRLSS